MKQTRIKYLVLVLIVLFPVILILFTITQKNLGEELEIETELIKIIEKLSSKDLSFEDFIDEYSYMNIDENFGEEQIPFHSHNILTFIPPEIMEYKEHKACIDFSQENYQNIFDEYQEELAYEVEVGEIKKELNLKIKTFDLRGYHLVLSLLTDFILEDPTKMDDFELFFASRCKALKEMQKNIGDYKNKEYQDINLKYQIKNGKLVIEDMASLGWALVGGFYNDDSTEEAANETGERAYNIAKKYYEALK